MKNRTTSSLVHPHRTVAELSKKLGESEITIRRAISAAGLTSDDGLFPFAPVFRAVFELHQNALAEARKKSKGAFFTR